MKTILFPTDFSDSSTTALDWAKQFARQYAATLILFHVQQIPVSNAALPTAGGIGLDIVDPGLMLELEPLDRERLDQLAAQIRAEGITCQTELRWGAVVEAIITAADELHADLIITGRGHVDSFLDRLTGTDATGIARRAHCPVLIVPTREGKPAQVHSILFTTSLEFDQPTEFEQVVGLARTFGAALSVLHVHAENRPAMADIEQMTAQLQAQFGSDTLPVTTVEARTVTGGIESYLDTSHPDLLVMASRERGFLSGLLNPSLTDRMVKLTDTPILIYHTQGDL